MAGVLSALGGFLVGYAAGVVNLVLLRRHSLEVQRRALEHH